jgi:hypothetical protein
VDSRGRLFRLTVAALIFFILAGVGGRYSPALAKPFAERCADAIFYGEESDDELEDFLRSFSSAFLGSDLPVDSLKDAVETFRDGRGGREEYETLRAQLLDFCHFLVRLTGGQLTETSGNSFGGTGLARRANEAGDPDGEGMLLLYHNTQSRQTCYLLAVKNITLPATAANIHRGGFGENGDVVIALKAPAANGMVANCFPMNAKNQTALEELLVTPMKFYVSVVNKEFPSGAIRGQVLGAFKLDGTKEVPGPGDKDGYGVGTLLFDKRNQQLCYALIVAQITLPATEAHIAVGARGEEGPVVIPINPPDKTGWSNGCVKIGDGIDVLHDNAHKLYVNILTKDQPKGAIRGQPPF